MMLEVGLTGGIGTGKSTVSKIFKILQIPVYDADEQAKKLVANDPKVKSAIMETFGSEAYLSDGKPNRNFLAKHVFGDDRQVQRMNSIVHPAVRSDYLGWVADQQKSGAEYVINEAALLFEAGRDAQLHLIITVDAPFQLRIARIRARDPFRTEQEIRDIIARQMPQQEKVSKAKFVIRNDEQELMIPQVIQIHHQLRQLSTIDQSR